MSTDQALRTNLSQVGFDAADRTLLDAGWHLVYVEVPDRYGDPVAMAAWWSAYCDLRSCWPGG